MTNYFSMIFTPVTELKGNQASEAQQDLYKKLCLQKRLEPINIEFYNGKQLYDLNSELMKYYPASEPQLERISNSIATLKSAGVNIEADTSNLTGGKEGTASLLIGKLKELLDKHQVDLPPTEAQLNMLKDMYLCIDVPFEDVGISRRVELEEGNWRKATPEEFKSLCESSLTKSSASEFIGKYKNIFSQWKITRPSMGQIERIRQLEDRLKVDSKIRELPVAIMIDGEKVELSPIGKEAIKGETYVPLTDEDILLFEKETASAYITQLEAELSRRKEWDKDEPYDETQVTFRPAKSQAEASIVEYEVVLNMLHQLEAIAGWGSDELHESFNINLVEDDSPSSYQENRAVIRDFMTEMIDSGSIDFGTLMDFVKESRTLQRILLEV